MDFNNINEDLLLSLVKQQDIIWNRRRDDYNDREKTQRAWTRIARTMFPNYDNYSEAQKRDVYAMLTRKWRDLLFWYMMYVEPISSPNAPISRNASENVATVTPSDEAMFSYMSGASYGNPGIPRDADSMFFLSLVEKYRAIPPKHALSCKVHILNTIDYFMNSQQNSHNCPTFPEFNSGPQQQQYYQSHLPPTHYNPSPMPAQFNHPHFQTGASPFYYGPYQQYPQYQNR